MGRAASFVGVPAAVLAAVAIVVAPGCGGYAPRIDSAEFVREVTNRYFPLEPGTTTIFESRTDEGLERIEDTVTGDRREVMGVSCIVLHDRVTLNDELIEDTYDWYAQDRDGNVWYFGEDSKSYEKGKAVSTKGSWEAGVDGAQPGIIMEAGPRVGDEYRQEYYKGEAEDMARVIELGATAEVPAGSYEDVLVTTEWTPLEPSIEENKYFAPGVGLVLEEFVKGGTGRTELTEIKKG